MKRAIYFFTLQQIFQPEFYFTLFCCCFVIKRFLRNRKKSNTQIFVKFLSYKNKNSTDSNSGKEYKKQKKK